MISTNLLLLQSTQGVYHYKRSKDGGKSWGSDTRLTYAVAESFNPSISVADSVVHVLWYDARHSNYEIYYKRNPSGGMVFNLILTATVEGFYSPAFNSIVPDTVNAYLRNDVSPYAILDSSKSVLNSLGTGFFQIKHLEIILNRLMLHLFDLQFTAVT